MLVVLSDRSQTVCLEGHFSELIRVRSGVPQGSVLGPILFLLFINDLPKYISSHAIKDPNSLSLKIFADGIKIYACVTNLQDYFHIQTSLSHILAWCDRWQLQISIGKCIVLHMGKTNPRFDYELNNITLPTSHCVKDFGIKIDDALAFSLQYSSAVSKLARILPYFCVLLLGAIHL